jgi:two-component system LytT family sensor kinase
MIDLVMGRPVYRKLIITAFVTSIAFGGFAMLNFYIFRELLPLPRNGERIIYVQPGDGPAGRLLNHGPLPERSANQRLPHKPPAFDQELFLFNNSMFVSVAMLVVWLLNIGILLIIGKISMRPLLRRIIRYIASYMLIGIVIISIIYPDTSIRVLSHNAGTPGLGGPVLVSPSPHPTPTYRYRTEKGQLPFMTAFVINTIVLAILELILLQDHKSRIELEYAQLKMSHLMARHQHLQHQLQPHFLFNSLSTLKSLIRVSAIGAEEYLLRLSFFLRSSLARNELALHSLAEELQLCMYYLEMQQIRYGNALRFHIQIPEQYIASLTVPAFSLQLLVENAIKHNSLTTERPLVIDISYHEERTIQVKNNKQIKLITEPSSSIGLKNLSERYKMISGDDILIESNEHYFIVTIKALKK